jgi:hypothetical protein
MILRRPPVILGVAAVLLVTATTRRASADVTYQAQTAAEGSSPTVRIPNSGTFSVPTVPGAYLTLSVALYDADHAVSSVRWSLTGSASSQSFTRQSQHDSAGPSSSHCRTEIWGLPAPALGAGAVTVQIAAINGPAPATQIIATLIAYAHVAGSSVAGPCCSNVASDGTGSSTITKTLAGIEHGDFLVDSVCVTWPLGATTPGLPDPDLAVNSELVSRNVTASASPNLFALVQTSGTSNIPAGTTSTKTLQWQQSGSREWALTGVVLLGQPAPPVDAAPPPDAPPPPPEAGVTDGSPSDGVTMPDASAEAGSSTADAASTEAGLSADAAAGEVLPFDAGARPDAAPAAGNDAPVEAEGHPIAVNLAVGCACRTGGGTRGGGLLVLLLSAACGWRQARGARPAPRR